MIMNYSIMADGTKDIEFHKLLLIPLIMISS